MVAPVLHFASQVLGNPFDVASIHLDIRIGSQIAFGFHEGSSTTRPSHQATDSGRKARPHHIE